MKPTLLFDYGGTLDTAARHWSYVLLDAYRQVVRLEPQLAKVEGSVWREAYVHGERTLAREVIILPTDDFHALLQKKVRIELDYLRHNHILDLSDERTTLLTAAIADHSNATARRHIHESRTVLETLQQRGYRFVLVTNFYGNISAVLRGYGLSHFFPTIIESAVVGVRKPDPAIWQKGVEASGTSADRCIAIGDSFGKDILPAREVGCSTIWFKGEEWEEKHYDESLPTHIITHLPDLLHLLP